MSRLKNGLRCYCILCKRLLHKKSFVIILLLIPVIIGATWGIVSTGDGGVITVTLAMQDGEDATAKEIVTELAAEKGLIRFIACDSPEEAVENVRDGSADVAWIFPKNLKARIEKFARNTSSFNSFVTVVQREDNVLLRLSQEKLNSALYPHISRVLFADRMNAEFPELDEDAINNIYNLVDAEGEELFEFLYMNGDESLTVREEKDNGFLLSPLRGILAIMIVIGGIAVSMFYMQDEQRGVFDRLPRGANFSFACIYHAAAVAMMGVVVLITLFAIQMTTIIWLEILALVAYCVATVGFCMGLRLIVRDIRLFGSIATVLVVIMAVLCPVFLKAPDLPFIQYLLPTYHYLNVFSNTNFLLYMLIYDVVSLALVYSLHYVYSKCKK